MFFGIALKLYSIAEIAKELQRLWQGGFLITVCSDPPGTVPPFLQPVTSRRGRTAAGAATVTLSPGFIGQERRYVRSPQSLETFPRRF